ncbi:MAG: ABC transporter substrate-binding protein [Kouleothrix sp.]|nr:ABC transporter substrate-binding protein [Kouleothrix sp.]
MISTTTPAAPAAPEALATGPLHEVPRSRTLVLGWGTQSPIGVTNPWAVPGYTHQEGNNLLWEGLSYYAIFADKDIPWLADSMEYTKPDFAELTIKLNTQATWSDGVPITSKDVLFTFEGQMKNDKLPYHAQFNQYVQAVKAVDDQTVVVTFKIPAPRFKFEVLTLKFDTGIPIVPEHVLSKQADVNAFAGGLDMPHSGPYTLVQWDKNQKIYDLRADWWAIKAGRALPPDVRRVTLINVGNQDNSTVAQRIVNNEVDSSTGMPPAVIGTMLEQNAKITSYTGKQPPYGNLDWWPVSLWMNTQLAPYSDVRVRRAISLAIDRDTLDELLYEGAKVTTIYPFPLYPGLQRFVDSPAVKALEATYQPRRFDLDASATLMTDAGFTKNADGLWQKNGQTVNATINGFAAFQGDIAPLLEEMLKNGGFDASVYFGADAYQHMRDGQPGLYLYGHGASLTDPYATLDMYHSRYSRPQNQPAVDGYWSRYKNRLYDTLLDQMAPLSSDDPLFQADAAKALEIYWKEQIDIPVIQWLHRIPFNQTYWTNWPTRENPAGGTIAAFWAHTGMLVITQLKATQESSR